MNKKNFVAFATTKLESSYEALTKGKRENFELFKNIEKAIQILKIDPLQGIKIQKRLWPKEYISKYSITNLFKYNLPKGFRIIYTIQTNEVISLVIILDYFNHKDYNKKFRY